MAPHEFKKLLDKYAQGTCSKSEEDFILEWYEKIGKDHQHELREEFQVVIEAKLWSRLQDRMGKSNRHTVDWKKMAAAIAIFLVVGAGTFILSYKYDSVKGTEAELATPVPDLNMISIRNTSFIAEVIKLHDGSEVTLQPQSEIQFPKSFGPDREVYLKGEAFFNVSRDPNHPFLVYSNEVVTRVLGTSFNVKAYADSKNITVAVKTGRVSVYKNLTQTYAGDSNKEVILTPNQQAVYDRSKDEVSKQLVSKPEIVSRSVKEPTMQYDGAQVVKIFGELEEMYGVDIDFDSEVLVNCTLTTSMKEEGLFERIKVICEAIGAQYEVQNTSILIKSEGCNN
jgi:transmembrane sensor